MSMKHKGPPYEVNLGIEGQAPPAYVRAIYEGKVTLGGELERLGLKDEISFNSNGKVENNPELIELMLSLNSFGVVFSYDPKVMLSPSSFMANLQDQEVLLGSFKEISWRNPKLWHLTTYELT